MNATVTTGSTDLTAAFDTIFDYVTVLRAEAESASRTAAHVEEMGEDAGESFTRARTLRAQYTAICTAAHDLEERMLDALPSHD